MQSAVPDANHRGLRFFILTFFCLLNRSFKTWGIYGAQLQL